ncbi:MAG: DUF1772 domain-containing protein [Deltaproteobacteria bacterium]|nr:DUF1772 domain-containing protein [Nannocystaceae bacterium]
MTVSVLDRFVGTAIFATAIGAGLAAGSFFVFSSMVMPGLARLAPAHGVAAMQALNVAAISRVFLGVFLGTAVASLALAVAAVLQWSQPDARLRLLAGLAYAIGCFGVTIAANVPRNDALAALAPDSAEALAMWPRYLAQWTAYNHLRTVAATLSCALYIGALLLRAS